MTNAQTDARSAGPDVAVRDNTVEDQFELYVDGMPAGVLTYTIEDNTYALHHEEIDEHFQGRGMGSKFVTQALDSIRAGGHGVLPFCPFVQSFLQGHPEYHDLVPTHRRAQFDLPAK